MAYATLKQDIIAYEMDNVEATKYFPAGSIIDVEDDDDGWFAFYPADDDIVYECEEQPEVVLAYEAKDSGNSSAKVKGYQPVPNMTPKDKRLLL